MHIVFIGAPGVGKGTQAQRLREQKNWTVIATGDLLREAMAIGSPLGLEAKQYIERGELVPDQLVNNLVAERLQAAEGGFILDGYPRNVMQAEQLETVLQKHRKPLDKVVKFDLPEEVLIRRLSGRRVCPQCGAVYHLESNPSRLGEQCESCEATLVTRADDNPETVQRRLQVYAGQTQPLIEYYESRGLLTRVPAEGTPDEVYARLLQALGG
jgi:adenylate kinase